MIPVLNFVTRTVSCQKLLRPKDLILRRISILEKIRGKPNILDKTNHKVIYEFKYVVYTAGFLKAKYLLPIVSVPFISACFYLNQPKMALLFIVANVFQFLLIIAVSKLAKNMIGKIYVNKEGKTDNVIISYIDSNGSRIDKSFCPDQLYLSEFGLMTYLGFLTVKSANENYKLNIRNAYVHDVKTLQGIFLDILSFIKVKDIKKVKKKWREAACLKFYSQYSPRFKEPVIDKDKLDELLKEISKEDLENIKVKAPGNDQTCSVFFDADIVKFTNFIMRKGKREVAHELVRLAFARIKHIQIRKYNNEPDENLKKEIILDPRQIFHLAVKNCTPVLTVTKIKRSGVWYKIPTGIKPNLAKVTAMKWIIEVAKQKKHKSDPFEIDLANELIEASQSKGRAYLKKIELHKLCETNKSYAHFWWT